MKINSLKYIFKFFKRKNSINNSEKIDLAANEVISTINFKANKILAYEFNHLKNALPKLVNKPAIKHADSLQIANRLISAYHLSIGDSQYNSYLRNEKDLWTDIVEKELAELIAILNDKNADKLANYLMHFGESYTWFGGLTFSIDGYNYLDNSQEGIAKSYFDKLICLAVSIGSVSHENPEQGAWGELVNSNVNELLMAIERETGTSLFVPEGIIPVTGIESTIGPIHYRHLNAYYAAWRVKNLADSKNNSSVCEYGAGNGIAAYYAHKMGVHKYTTLDIPITNVFSGWFLINALGADKVQLHGEKTIVCGISILPSWKCADIQENQFDVVLNQDSFPEIDKTLLLKYFKIIKNTGKKYFLSINHETESPMADVNHSNVAKILKQDADFHLLARSKYWIRQGYVEELYEIIKQH